MFRKILSVGGWTLVSRLTGFVRDVVLAAIMGVGPMADAFVVASRIPNHFRAIFSEGAFNSAFLPTYAGVLEREGAAGALLREPHQHPDADRTGRASRLALFAMPVVVMLLAPGFSEDPAKFDLAVTLTRITFPYLLLRHPGHDPLGACSTPHERFAAAAAAPVLFNVAIVAALALAVPVPQCRLCRGLGRHGLGRARTAAASGCGEAASASRRGSRRRAWIRR